MPAPDTKGAHRKAVREYYQRNRDAIRAKRNEQAHSQVAIAASRGDAS